MNAAAPALRFKVYITYIAYYKEKTYMKKLTANNLGFPRIGRQSKQEIPPPFREGVTQGRLERYCNGCRFFSFCFDYAVNSRRTADFVAYY
jgi:hypothetical protein